MPLGRIDEETVANIGTISGGEARTSFPARFYSQGMARSHDQAKLDDQLGAMRNALSEAASRARCDSRLRSRGDIPDLSHRRVGPPIREAGRAIRSLGSKSSRAKVGAAPTATSSTQRHPCVAMATGMVDEHATSEHIAVEDMVTACKILVTIATQGPE